MYSVIRDLVFDNLPIVILIITFLLSFVTTMIPTRLIYTRLKKRKVLYLPTDKRWHKTPTPTFGGVAIFSGYMLNFVLFIFLFSSGTQKPDLRFIGILIGGFIMFNLGLYDDMKNMKSIYKLGGQFIATIIVMSFGVYVEIIEIWWISVPITLLWIVGITNAFNLLDNMDGLSAGIATIGALILGINSLILSYPDVTMLTTIAFILAGSCLGFLRYNFRWKKPSAIFMGDCGSLFLGFNLATLSLVGTWKDTSNLFVTMIVPFLVLIVPIFDTTFVTILRKLEKRPIDQGGRDHTSHHLVYSGYSEKQAVVLLYVISFFSGIASLLYIISHNKILIFIIIAIIIILLIILGINLEKAGRKKRTPE